MGFRKKEQEKGPEEEIFVGLDIGTTKVCAVVAAPGDHGKLNILGIGNAVSDGLTRGVVTNIDRTVRSIDGAVREAEAQSGVKIRTVTVGIAGDHIQSFQSRGVIAISGSEHEISRADVDRLIEDTKRVALPADRRIIHVIPQEFIVDGQDGVFDPVGMSGVRMEATVHIITGLVTAAQNIYKCVERAGLSVNDMVLEPLASSYAVLEEEEKEVGTVLIDIGGGTTDVAVFEERTIRHTAVIGIAGKKVTDDIRKGLGILSDQAERLKKEHGFAYLPAIVDNEPLVLPGIGGRSPIEIDKKLLAQIIQPRMEEILEIVSLEIKRSGYSKHLFAGAVLTGGGSLIKGTVELAREVLGMPVKMGIPAGFGSGLVREIENPMYATAVGLILYRLRHRDRSTISFDTPKKHRSVRHMISKMTEWFNEL
ncbi:MAG: cell division protein FtsA [Ignavibacteriales bacterium CG07_land_8_20_14_0_80_59_12]|nr:MAG: cell division protein FtsA [Ignavibacteriales bacterium CG07_land_8_20_14_0_80_59_12]